MSTRFTQALAFAAAIHERQIKGPRSLPFIAHPMGVASLVMLLGGNEDQAVVAILHDTIEAVSRETLTSHFGAEISRRAFLFETPAFENTDWRSGRIAYQNHLKTLDASHLLVVACEEMHELQEWTRDCELAPVLTWQLASAPPAEWVWHFTEMGKTLREKLRHEYRPAADAYDQALDSFSRAAGQATR